LKETLLDIFAAYATYETKEEVGVVVFLLQADPDKPGDKATDPWIQVARQGNTAYTKAVTADYAKLMLQRKAEKLSEVEMEIRSKNMMTELMARTILMDFGNLEFQGKKLVPSFETKLQLLRVKDFRELVAGHSANMELFRYEVMEAAAGN
jgi:hypothetical protein